MRFAYVLLGVVTLASVHISSGLCSNGVDGVQTGDTCCMASCGSCGGPGCSSRPGGGAGCCQQAIWSSGTMCSDTYQAPCIVDECTDGVYGVASGKFCCEGQCVTCGGEGCVCRPGGKDSCCTTDIDEAGVMCSTTSQAPCIIDGVDIEEN